MIEYVYHSVDAGHIRNIGEQSVSNKIQAILELIKNAYDADALNCTVTFHGTEDEDGKEIKIHTITIEDDGIGMTKNDLSNEFMKVGTGAKVETSFSSKLQRRVSGEKGMGHYSAQRLGEKIVITTTPDLFKDRQFNKYDNTTYVLELDWKKYVSGKSFERIPNKMYTIARQTTGTQIKISELRDNWTIKNKNNDLELLNKNVKNIMLPKVMRITRKDEFDVHIKSMGFKTNLQEPKGALLDHALYKIYARLHENRISFKFYRRKKKDTSMQIIKDGKIPTNAVCGDASITIYWFPGGGSNWTNVVISRRELEEQLKNNSGVKIYNDKIRIMPYGEYGNDWLGLETRKSGPAAGDKVRNVHLIGFLNLTRKNNPKIMETTTRQALRENYAFKSLKDDFVLPVIEVMENKVRIINKNEEESAKKVHHNNSAQAELAKVKNITSELPIDKHIKEIAIKKMNTIERHIISQETEYKKREENLSANLEMYRNLSTVGIQTIAFNHEIINPLNLMSLTLTNLIKKHNSIDHVKRTKYLEKCLNNTLTTLNWASHIKEFTSLLSDTNLSRRQSVIKIKDLLQEIRKDMQPILSELDITMHEPIIVDLIPNITMNKASFESIFINLIANSVRSLKRVDREGIIKVTVSQDKSNLRIEFEDNGYGIDDDDKDRIFNLFFTTYKNESDAGTGMGLTIIKEIIEDDYHGKIMLAETISEKTNPGRGMAKFLIRLPL